MELPSNQKGLFFSPHPDDEIISAGALLYSLVISRNVVSIYYLANSPKGVHEDISDEEKIKIRQNEAKSSCAVLGISANFLNLDSPTLEVNEENINLVRKIVSEEKPTFIITLHSDEAHPTHQKTTQLVNNAIENQSLPIWYGEVWSPIQKPTDMFFFDEELMDIKLRAMEKYQSQLKRTNWIEAVKNLNRYRALTSGEILKNFGQETDSSGQYAEAFVVHTKE